MRRSFKRYEQLFAKNEISRQSYEGIVAARAVLAGQCQRRQGQVAAAQKQIELRQAQIDVQQALRDQTTHNAPRRSRFGEADVATAEADVEAAAAQLQRAALNLSDCHIVWPVHGIVTGAQRGDRQSDQ